MTRLQDHLGRACKELGLDIAIPFALVLPSGRRLLAEAMLPQLGSPKGMLVVSNYEVLHEVEEEVVNSGYGYSVIDEPPAGEEYDVTRYRHMFVDWDWNAGSKGRPEWMG